MKIHKKILFVALLMAGVIVAGCGQSFWGPGVNADLTPPTVSSTNPVDSATNVAINRQIAATFSEVLAPASVNTSTFTLKQGTTSVPCTVSCVGLVATLKPTSNLATNTTYTATITTGVTDLAGNTMVSNKTWTFITGTSADTTAPTVSAVVPADTATGVAVNASVTANFSEAIDPATMTTTTFTLKQGTTSVASAVTLVDTVATLKPASNLTNSTLYTATITTGAADLAGNTLAVSKTWTFTTGTVSDTTAPTVTSVSPADASTGAAVTSNVLITFSEAMDPATITTANFTLMNGTTAVSGVVSHLGNVTTFNPISDLTANTIYVAKVTKAAKDLAGNALAADKTWSFKTVATGAPAGPAAVDLGIASDYVILGKSGIDTTGTTRIFGNIGVSPAAAAAITGFSLVPDASNVFSTSIYVSAPGAFAPSTGKVYASNYAAPTPADMTAAISAIEAAYTDATGRSASEIVNAGSGLLGGLTLAPGLYTFDTGVDIATDLTLAGGANDVWIFKTTGTLKLASATQVILSGGAQAKNVYWAAADYVELGTTSNMKGNIIGQTRIDMLTGSSLTGRLLAQTAINLQAATVTKP